MFGILFEALNYIWELYASVRLSCKSTGNIRNVFDQCFTARCQHYASHVEERKKQAVHKCALFRFHNKVLLVCGVRFASLSGLTTLML